MQLDEDNFCQSLTAILPSDKFLEDESKDKLDNELSSITDKMNFKVLELCKDKKLIKLS